MLTLPKIIFCNLSALRYTAEKCYKSSSKNSVCKIKVGANTWLPSRARIWDPSLGSNRNCGLDLASNTNPKTNPGSDLNTVFCLSLHYSQRSNKQKRQAADSGTEEKKNWHYFKATSKKGIPRNWGLRMEPSYTTTVSSTIYLLNQILTQVKSLL